MRALTVILILISGLTYAQEPQVDLVRLSYQKTETESVQVGMTVSADGNHAAFAFRNKTVRILDVRAGKFVKRLNIPFTEVFDMHLTNNGRLIVMQLKEVIIVDWKADKTLISFTTAHNITKSAFSAAHNLLAVGQREGWVGIYNVQTLTQVNTLQYKKHHVSALAIHPNGKSIAVAVMPVLKEMNPIRMYQIDSGNEVMQSKRDFIRWLLLMPAVINL